MTISLVKPQIGDEEKQAVLEVLDSGMLAQGPRTAAFEEAFAELCETKYAVATTSGTTALHVALLANGVGPGDEVITSPFTFIASANSVLFTGARPVFVDIDPDTFNLDVTKIEAAITPHTRAIMPVHLYGQACDMDAIMAIAEKHELVVIEDACQSHGARYKGKRVGSFATGTFSLYPSKNMTSGEGGMITSNDEQVVERCQMIRSHGMRRRYYHEDLGFNFRMSDLHAAIGLEQIKKLPGFTLKRQQNAAYLNANLKGVKTPVPIEGYEHVYHQYSILVPDGKRDVLRDHLKENEIGCEIFYPIPINRQEFYVDKLGYDVAMPVAEKIASEVLCLPVHPALSQDDLDTIVDTINRFMER